MTEIIAAIILLSSLFGMGMVLIRKIPVLKELEIPPKTGIGFFSLTRERIKKAFVSKPRMFFKSDFWNIFFQKILSKIRVLSLKTETKTGHLLEKMRERTRKRKESKKYWEKISKFSLRAKKED